MRFLLTILSLTALLCGCAEKEPDESPTPNEARIVALSPAAGDILWHLELADRVVGRHNYDALLGGVAPAMGDQSAIDYERLLESRPTHVIVQTESQPVPVRLQELSQSLGFEILNISTLSLDDIHRTIRVLESAFERGDALSTAFAHAVRQRVQKDAPTVLVAMHCSPTVDVLGPGSAHHQIVERLGAAPAITEGRPYLPLDAEDMLAVDPGVIILIQPRSGRTDEEPKLRAPTREELGVLDGLGLRAVREGRLHLIDHPQALASGASLIAVAGAMEKAIERAQASGPSLPSDRDEHSDNPEGERHDDERGP